jgi:prephenate dehydratase
MFPSTQAVLAYEQLEAVRHTIGWYKSRVAAEGLLPNSQFCLATFRYAFNNRSTHMRIAIQGEPGSFSHVAALQMDPRAKIVPCAVAREVFDAVKNNKADAIVLPVENSLAGTVGEHLDLLFTSGLHVNAEHRLRIEHNLIVAPGVALKNVKRVISHPVALDQCREFLADQKFRVEPFYDTAGSVKHIMDGHLKDTAAIASSKAAEQYKAEILKRGIEDDKQNFTRFLLVEREQQEIRGADKTSVAFALKNAPGALFKALSVFALRDIDLSKIESRPMRGRPWEYVFFADILRGHDEAARNALAHLREIADPVIVLGVYKSFKQ